MAFWTPSPSAHRVSSVCLSKSSSICSLDAGLASFLFFCEVAAWNTYGLRPVFRHFLSSSPTPGRPASMYRCCRISHSAAPQLWFEKKNSVEDTGLLALRLCLYYFRSRSCSTLTECSAGGKFNNPTTSSSTIIAL